MRDVNRPSWVLWALCAIALVVRLGGFLALDRLHHPDVWESETIAMNLLQGKGFVFPFLGTEYRSYQEPLHPALCAAVYAATGHNILALGIVHIVLGTVVVGCVFVCARRIVSSGAAMFATALAALHPGLVLYTTKFHPLILDVLLLLLVLISCLSFSARHPWRSAVVLGLLIGLCTLTRPTVLACLPVVWWWVWTRSLRPRVVRLAHLLLIPLVTATVVGPWVWRNYQVHHQFILTRSGTPMVFWLGNNPYQFTGSALSPEGEALLINAAPPEVQQRILSLDELGQQEFLLSQAWGYVRDHPGAFLKRWVLKLWYFWWFTPQAGLLYPTSWFRMYQAVYVMLVVLVGLGFVGHWRAPGMVPLDRHAARLVGGVCLSIALVQSLFYIEGRHRLAIEPLLVMFAGQGLWWLWGMRHGWRQA